MSNITYVDGDVLLTLRYDESSVLIYVKKYLGLTFFQISILESYFSRIMFYCGLETNIDINIERLKNDDVYITAYMYNKYQDYDFCGTFETVYIAIYYALKTLSNASIYDQSRYYSIDNDIYNDDYDYSEVELETESEEDKLENTGRLVDELFNEENNNDNR